MKTTGSLSQSEEKNQFSGSINSKYKKIDHFLKEMIGSNNGYLSFESWMDAVLYSPDLGYYETNYLQNSRNSSLDYLANLKNSDFITGPQLSPLFTQTITSQVMQILELSSSENILELGAGTGALAETLLFELKRLGIKVKYQIIEISKKLRKHQQERLKVFGNQISWLNTFPKNFYGCILANEFLDALPASIFHWSNNGQVLERGVGIGKKDEFKWVDREANKMLTEAVSKRMFPIPGYISEVNFHAEKWLETIAKSLKIGAVIFFDYGFPQSEYYHPQRNGGTLMCHFQHRAHSNPLLLPGKQDITTHVDFTFVAQTGINYGLDILGYASQARFLINLGILDKVLKIEKNNLKNYAQKISAVQILLSEAEMGELFKVLALGRGIKAKLTGFTFGNRSHTL